MSVNPRENKEGKNVQGENHGWPIGLSMGCFYKQSIFSCLDAVGYNGFNIIEICSSPMHLDYHDKAAVHKAAKIMKDLTIKAHSVHAPFSDDIDITSLDAGQRDHSVKEMISVAESAAVLQTRYFVIHPGPERNHYFSGEERLQRMQNAASSLKEISCRCKKLDQRLALENMLPHLLFGHVNNLRWLLDALHDNNIAVCFDTGHANLSHNMHGILNQLSNHIQMMHANDNFGKSDEHLPPGKGQIDWEHLLQEMVNIQFQGTLILELSSREYLNPKQVIKEAGQAQHFLKVLGKKVKHQRSNSNTDLPGDIPGK